MTSADWRLQQALAALFGGVRVLREQDPDLNIDLNEHLPDESADAKAAIVAVARAALEAERLSDMVADMLKDLQMRKQRFDARAQRCRGMVLGAMDTLEIKRLEEPDLTLSLGVGRQTTIIADEKALPAEYWRTPPKEINKAAIAADLKVGVVIPGVVQSNGLPTITIRTR